MVTPTSDVPLSDLGTSLFLPPSAQVLWSPPTSDVSLSGPASRATPVAGGGTGDDGLGKQAGSLNLNSGVGVVQVAPGGEGLCAEPCNGNGLHCKFPGCYFDPSWDFRV